MATKLTNMQQQALSKALGFLKASGASYIILEATDEGEVQHTSPDLAKSYIRKRVRNSPRIGDNKRSIVNDFVKATNYLKQMADVPVGEELRFHRKDYPIFNDKALGDTAWKSFRASVRAHTRNRMKPDTFVLDLDDQGSVGFLKVE